jgi:hypothetical protein
MRRTFFALSAIAAVTACGGGDKSTAPNAVPPVVDSINPTRGTVGTIIRVMGSGFTDSARVYFNGLVSPSVTRQGNQLFVTAPEGLVLGTTYGLRVVNRDGGADTIAAAFQVVSPTVARVNGVTKPSGLVGMTVLIEGDAFGDSRHGKVFFAGTGNAAPIQATISDTANDWTNNYIVTTVPAGVTSVSQITVQTATGTSSSVSFSLISGSTFSPSTINWTQTTALPQPLQGLGAAFVPAANASVSTATYVFVVGGAADQTNAATTSVYRAQSQQSGALSGWTPATTALPVARAYHATVAASAFTAALDTTTTEAYLYAIGGVDSSGTTVSTVYYSKVALDGSNGAWLPTTPLPAASHSASAVVFRGYLYVAGGANAQNAPTLNAYRAAVNADGTLGVWQPIAGLPSGAAFQALVNFGPYLYAVGGDGSSVAPMQGTTSGGEMSSAFLARVNLRTGDLAAPWAPVSSMSKGRSKHNTVVGGGYLFTTSGVYAGSAGSSENTYSAINADGTLGSWNGATGTNTIGTLLGYDLYNETAISFVDAGGRGHVLVLGGAKREAPGRASAAVVYY